MTDSELYSQVALQSTVQITKKHSHINVKMNKRDKYQYINNTIHSSVIWFLLKTAAVLASVH